jgi:glycosyltransferase involved in cell wall biosynthesis
VALLLPNLVGGGAERATLDLAGGLRASGVDVDLVLARAEGALRDAVPAGVRVVELDAPRVLRMLPALRRYLSSERPAAVISNIHHANLIGIAACRSVRPRVPVVVTEHNTRSMVTRHATSRRDRWAAKGMSRLYPFADRIVCVSHGVADDLARVTGIPRDRIDVIHNPVVYERIQRLAAVAPGHPWLVERTGPVLVAVGRLTPQKDFATLLRALALLPPDHRLVVLGEGEQRLALEKLAAELGVSDRVDLVGHVDNPHAYVAASDVLAVASRWEGFSLVLAEALPFDVRLVSTDCPHGPREVLHDGRWGALVPIGEPAALAAALSDAACARPAQRPAASWGRFDVEVATGHYLDLLTAVGR